MESAAIANKYKKLEGREHVLTRPGMYVGSIEEDNHTTWVYNTEEKKMIKRSLKYIAGLYKIFDEILVNAIDHVVRLKSDSECKHNVKTIKVTIDKVNGVIDVFNDGEGIEVVKHPEYNIYIPELIFGNLLTSTNYDDKEEKIIGGQNGLGSKIASIFSKWFELETVDSKRKLLYNQRFEENMSVIRQPNIEKYTKKPYTRIRFHPDYARFGLSGLTDDMYDIMVKRVYDACAVTDNDITIYLNEEKLEYKNFENYVNLYLGDKNSHTRVAEKINDRWEVIASYNDFSGFEQISFVNGIWTLRGGKHVEYIVNQITKKLIEMINKKKKDLNIKPQIVKDNLIVFVKSTIVNPSFDSQSKETLTTPASKFGSKAEVSDKFIEKLFKSGIVERICEISNVVETQQMKKTDGKKRNVIKGLPKLDDANWAGTNKSKDCVLILTEGDSAKTMAISGLSEVGRDRFGVFPLRGKVMNVKDMNLKKISENEEISSLKKILGLESGKVYDSVDDLRYGKIMLMVDQDVDGSHIKGLLFNLFHSLWPSLLTNNTFLTCMNTPIVKVRKGANIISFYTLTEYENWKSANNDGKGWDIKYYKGLGTSDAKEAKEYFRNIKQVQFKWSGNMSNECLDLAFNKKRADDRKAWLANYDRNSILDCADSEVPYEDFVNKELIHFSNYDLERSIPSLCDGFKISQRKIMYAALKKNLVDKEIKVAQFCGYVMEHTAYHHGDASLQAAIIGMAQDFVGSNNINLLKPNGQFGTRIQGGKDAGAPRYINTLLTDVAMKVFKREDQCVLNYLNDDGYPIEPEFYVPIIPMVLVNGALGIGTGFSTNIPCYNPYDIINVIQRMLRGEEINDYEMIPWYRGFKGTICKNGDKWVSRGIVRKVSATKIEVVELPVGYWTEDFKMALEEYYDKCPEFKSYESYYDDVNVHFELNFANSAIVDKLMSIDKNGFTVFENDFKLVSLKMLGTSNMYLFNEKGQITKYDTPFDIIKDFYSMRMKYYDMRKAFQLEEMIKDNALIENKIRFIRSVVAEEVKVHKMAKAELVELLEKGEYMKHNDNFDYILRIPIYNLTTDKVNELEDEYNKKCAEIDALSNKNIKDIWFDELEELKRVMVIETNQQTNIVNVVKKATRGRKKST